MRLVTLIFCLLLLTQVSFSQNLEVPTLSPLS